jgi:hypothetical protein
MKVFMLSVLDSIIQEFSSFKIEFSTSKPKKGNPFERDIGPGIKINSYQSLNEYDKKCKNFIREVKSEIELFISIEKNKINVMFELEEKLILLKTLVQTYLPEDMSLIFLGLDIRIPLHFFESIENGFKEKLTYFVKLSREFINILVEYIRQKLKLLKKAIKFEVNPQYHIKFPDPTTTDLVTRIKDFFPGLEWIRTDTDLVELIIGLHESNCVKTQTGELTQSMAIATAEKILNREIKHSAVKIHKAGNRLKNPAAFLEEVLGNYLKRIKKLEADKQTNA